MILSEDPKIAPVARVPSPHGAWSLNGSLSLEGIPPLQGAQTLSGAWQGQTACLVPLPPVGAHWAPRPPPSVGLGPPHISTERSACWTPLVEDPRVSGGNKLPRGTWGPPYQFCSQLPPLQHLGSCTFCRATWRYQGSSRGQHHVAFQVGQ
jgi:hypothetical protein